MTRTIPPATAQASSKMDVKTTSRLLVALTLLLGAGFLFMRSCGADIPPLTKGSATDEVSALTTAQHSRQEVVRAPSTASPSIGGPVENVGGERLHDANQLTIYTYSNDWQPLAGCRVNLRPARGHRLQRSSVIPLAEEAPGAHVVRELAQGDYEVVATVPFVDGAIGNVSVKPEGAQELKVVVAPRGDLVGGRVTDLHGSAVCGAVVESIMEDSSCPTQGGWCLTDSLGRFTFCRAAGFTSSYVSLALRDGNADLGIADSSRPARLEWGNLDGVLVTQPRKKAEIRLFDPQGQPLLGFTVDAQLRNSFGVFSRTVTSNGAGEAQMFLPTGQVAIMITPPAPYPPLWEKIDVEPDGRGFGTFRAKHPAQLHGVITGGSDDLDDKSIIVSILPRMDVATSGGDQAFGLTVLPRIKKKLQVEVAVEDRKFTVPCDPNQRYILRVAAKNCLAVERHIVAHDGVFPEVSIELQSCCTVNAIVEPPDATVWLEEYADQAISKGKHAVGTFLMIKMDGFSGTRPVLHCGIDESGKIQFEGVSPGKWLLRLVTGQRSELIRTLEISGADDVELGVIDLVHLQPGRVAGSCTWPQGLRPRVINVRTGAGGRFDVPLAPDGRFHFLAPAGDYVVGASVTDDNGKNHLVWNAESVRVLAGAATSTSLTIELNTLKVRVVDQVTGSGVPGAVLSIDEERATGVYGLIKTGADGTATIFPCPHGEFGLSRREPDLSWTSVARTNGVASNPLVIPVGR